MTVGQNVEMQVKDKKLIITVDLSKSFGTSSSGKSVLVASTGGNVAVPGDESANVGLNVYRPLGKSSM